MPAVLLDHIVDSSVLPIHLRLLHLAQSLGIPIAPTLYIPPESLFASFLVQKNIAALLEERANNKSDPAAIRLAEAKMTHLFQNEPLSASLTKMIHEAYHQNLQRSFVRLLPARNTRETLLQLYENITGDNNLLESIQFLASELFEQMLIGNRPATTSLLAHASGLYIQTQLPATSSGAVFSKHPKEPEKNVFAISARLGVRSDNLPETHLDWYDVHKSTLKEIAVRVGKKTNYYTRSADSLEKKAVATKQQEQRILSKEQTTLLATLAGKVSRKAFIPLTMEWELQKKTLQITAITELSTPHVVKKSNTQTLTTVVAPDDASWEQIDLVWKSQPENSAFLIRELADHRHLPPKTNIRIPQVTSLHELEAIRQSLLENQIQHQNWPIWPEITSAGTLHLLKEYTSLNFFSGILLDVPRLLQSLFVTPTWSEKEHAILFAIIESHVPTHIHRGLILEEMPSNTALHIRNSVYTHVHVPSHLAQSMQVLVSDLEVQRWNTLP